MLDPAPIKSSARRGSLRGSLSAPLTTQASQRLLEIQLTSIYGHISKASIISTLFALALALYLAPVFGEVPTHIWFGLKAGVALARFGLAYLYKTASLRSRPVLASRLVTGSLVMDGAIWGIAGLWAIHAPSEIVSLVIACLCSVAMLATFALQIRFQATAAYVLPMLAPTACALLLRSDTLGLFGACGMALTIVQALVTGYASERRMMREFAAREETAQALKDRSEALAQVSEAKAQLESALEDVKRQGAIKALFLGMMSHELRTPLHGILGLTELLQKEVEDPKLAQRLELLEASGSHLLEIIGSLLDIYRIDSGRLELHLAPYDLAKEVRQLVELYKVRCAAKGLELRDTVELPASHWVVGDASRVRQILHNLLGNAVKFTDRGMVRLEVSGQHGKYDFIVADTGPGIAEEDLPQIFDAFTQVGTSAARPSDGTGLGLTIARELALAMGGDIEVSSARGVGSKFSFCANLPTANIATLPARGGMELTPVRRLKPGYRVLLVDDNDVNALIATAHLERLGAEVTRAVDGKEAVVACFRGERPNVVLMDCRMPVMDGPSAARKIRTVERALQLAELPIIALTATSSDDDRRECFESGMNGFLTKPFSVEQLLEGLHDYIDVAAPAPAPQGNALLEFALSLDDMEPGLFGDRGGVSVH